METNEELLFLLLQTATSDGSMVDKLLNHIPFAYVVFGCNVENVVPRYCEMEILDLI